jgi:hypothetical protein
MVTMSVRGTITSRVPPCHPSSKTERIISRSSASMTVSRDAMSTRSRNSRLALERPVAKALARRHRIAEAISSATGPSTRRSHTRVTGAAARAATLVFCATERPRRHPDDDEGHEGHDMIAIASAEGLDQRR